MKVKLLFLVLLTSSMLFGGESINFQGIFYESDGFTPIQDGSHQITCKLYNDQAGGSAIWQETQTVNTHNGFYVIELGSIVPFTETLDFSSVYWLGISIDNNSELPRVKLSYTPYSFYSKIADLIGGLSYDDIQEKIVHEYVTIDTFTLGTDWEDITYLKIDVNRKSDLICEGQFFRSSGDGYLAAQLILCNSSLNVIDIGAESFYNPPAIMGIARPQIIFTVDPGTYYIFLDGCREERGQINRIYLSVFAIDSQLNKGKNTEVNMGLRKHGPADGKEPLKNLNW